MDTNTNTIQNGCAKEQTEGAKSNSGKTHGSSTSQHFHCYLLRSCDPRHPNKTYIGYTTNPYRRLRQHNGDLKNGAARRTRRSGRPWEFVAVTYGFPGEMALIDFDSCLFHSEFLAYSERSCLFPPRLFC